jgi:OOP family OmpA-OmpF porin
MGAKTFLVFFDWDKYNLTARSEGIVKEAADYSTHTSYTRIDVDGNTDTSGTPSYNQGLSERRARTVAAELVRDGVPQNVISMHAYGDTKLLVPTGPGVREPQNRRVEIVFH